MTTEVMLDMPSPYSAEEMRAWLAEAESLPATPQVLLQIATVKAWLARLETANTNGSQVQE
jgi:hypothetical protein